MDREQPKVLMYEEPLGAARGELHERFVRSYEDARVIVDLQGVDLIDGAFLVELAQFEAHRHTRGLQSIRLVIDSPYVRTALGAIGFERNYRVFTSMEDAVASFDGALQSSLPPRNV
jgi:anti-anti-sigma regulatory factor